VTVLGNEADVEDTPPLDGADVKHVTITQNGMPEDQVLADVHVADAEPDIE
jgi:hypothetical protein